MGGSSSSPIVDLVWRHELTQLFWKKKTTNPHWSRFTVCPTQCLSFQEMGKVLGMELGSQVPSSSIVTSSQTS